MYILSLKNYQTRGEKIETLIKSFQALNTRILMAQIKKAADVMFVFWMFIEHHLLNIYKVKSIRKL